MKCSVTSRAIAARQPVAADPAFFQMRGGDGQNVAFPFPGGEALRGVQRVLGRMRTAIHPDGALRAPREMMRCGSRSAVCESLSNSSQMRMPAKLGDVIGRVDAALILGQRDERCVPSVGAVAGGVVDWDAQVIAQLRAGQAFGLVFVEDLEIVPDAAEIDLAESGAAPGSAIRGTARQTWLFDRFFP